MPLIERVVMQCSMGLGVEAGTGPREVGEAKIGEEVGGGCCNVGATRGVGRD